MVEAEFGLELLILLLDGPALMGEPDQCFTDAVAGRLTKSIGCAASRPDPVRTAARPRAPVVDRASRGRG